MRKGAAGRRLLAPGALHLDRRIGRTLALYLVVITVIVGYNARAIADQRGSALSVNVGPGSAPSPSGTRRTSS